MKKGEIKGKQLFNITPDNKITYSQLFDEFMVSRKIKGLSEYTLLSYQYHSKYFKQFLKEDIPCNKITEHTLENYILYMQDVKGITNGMTINSYLQNISPILKYGMKKRYIEDFYIPLIKVQETFKDIYTQEELQVLLKKPKTKNFNEIRTWAIIWTLSSTGIRARELRELKIKNVDLLNKTIIVNSTKNKKPRVLPISNSLEEVLITFLKIRQGEEEDYLFPTVYGEQMASTTLNTSVKKYNKKRKVNKTSIHLFRHTFITNAVNKNINPLILKKITGHSSNHQLNNYYNAKTTDLVDVIEDITPTMQKKKSLWKKGK